jgi:hypothetical protein
VSGGSSSVVSVPDVTLASPFNSDTTELQTEAKSEPGASINDGSPYFTIGQQLREPGRKLSTYLSTGVHRAGGSVRRSVTALLIRRQVIRLLIISDFLRWQKTNRFPNGCQPVNVKRADRERPIPTVAV